MTLPSASSSQLAGGRIEQRQHARLLDADADGVNLRAQRGGELRGGHGINLPLVVVAVGQQDDDAALAVLEALEPLGAGGGGIADGRAQFANEADVQAVEVLDEPVVIERERAGQVGHGGENDQPDAVARRACG